MKSRKTKAQGKAMEQGGNLPLTRSALKMNGAGNEILVLDLRGCAVNPLTGAQARAIHALPDAAFDQLMVVYDAQDPDSAGAVKIFNNDGSLSAACGNGSRCVGWALLRASPHEELLLESDAGPLRVRRCGQWRFTVDMGQPRLLAHEIPLARAMDTLCASLAPPVPGAPKEFSAVGMGNPHAVFFVENAKAMDLAALGPQLETHPLFPEKANISFAQPLDRTHILLRVWERGAGATAACGTAACATLVAAARRGLTERQATLHLPGGDLEIDWRADNHVAMTGPVEFECEISLPPVIFSGSWT